MAYREEIENYSNYYYTKSCILNLYLDPIFPYCKWWEGFSFNKYWETTYLEHWLTYMTSKWDWLVLISLTLVKIRNSSKGSYTSIKPVSLSSESSPRSIHLQVTGFNLAHVTSAWQNRLPEDCLVIHVKWVGGFISQLVTAKYPTQSHSWKLYQPYKQSGQRISRTGDWIPLLHLEVIPSGQSCGTL